MFVFHGLNRPGKSHIWVVSYVVAVIIFACVISSGAYAQDGTNVEGEIVNDVWTWEGSPYYVTGPIRVIGELVINPGVLVDFLGNYGIEVVQNAVLTAKGIDNAGGRIWSEIPDCPAITTLLPIFTLPAIPTCATIMQFSPISTL